MTFRQKVGTIMIIEMVIKLKKEVQEIYINMDDSGVLHPNEKCCIYGGIVFTSKLDQENFGRKYKKILNQIKCKYCHSDITKCSHVCPEIKDTNIRSQHKRWIWNLIKKETCFAIIINNKKVNSNIMDNKDSRGRYRDYTQRILIKKVIDCLIKNGKIDPNLPIKLIIRIDQQATSTDTNREFVKDIEKELKVGMINLEYNIIHKPIVFSNLEIDLKYVLSHRHISIQASDFIAGETRRNILSKLDSLEMLKKLDYLNVKVFLP